MSSNHNPGHRVACLCNHMGHDFCHRTQSGAWQTTALATGLDLVKTEFPVSQDFHQSSHHVAAIFCICNESGIRKSASKTKVWIVVFKVKSVIFGDLERKQWLFVVISLISLKLAGNYGGLHTNLIPRPPSSLLVYLKMQAFNLNMLRQPGLSNRLSNKKKTFCIYIYKI